MTTSATKIGLPLLQTLLLQTLSTFVLTLCKAHQQTVSDAQELVRSHRNECRNGCYERYGFLLGFMYLGHQDLCPKAWFSPLMVLIPFSLERCMPQLPAVWDYEAAWGSMRIPWVLVGAGLGEMSVGSQELLLVNSFPLTNTLPYASLSCGSRAHIFFQQLAQLSVEREKSMFFLLKVTE